MIDRNQTITAHKNGIVIVVAAGNEPVGNYNGTHGAALTINGTVYNGDSFNHANDSQRKTFIGTYIANVTAGNSITFNIGEGVECGFGIYLSFE